MAAFDASPTRARLVVTKHAMAAIAAIASLDAVVRPWAFRPEQDRLRRRAAQFTFHNALRRLQLALCYTLQVPTDDAHQAGAPGADSVFVKLMERIKANPAFRCRPCAHGAILARF